MDGVPNGTPDIELDRGHGCDWEVLLLTDVDHRVVVPVPLSICMEYKYAQVYMYTCNIVHAKTKQQDTTQIINPQMKISWDIHVHVHVRIMYTCTCIMCSIKAVTCSSTVHVHVHYTLYMYLEIF